VGVGVGWGVGGVVFGLVGLKLGGGIRIVGREFEKNIGVRNAGLEILLLLQSFLDAASPAHYLLGFFRVIPEAGLRDLLF
jgi:hypothetical protein